MYERTCLTFSAAGLKKWAAHWFACGGVLLTVALILISVGGCTGESKKAKQPVVSAAHRQRANDKLFDTVAQTLNDLDQYVNLELRPMKVILDVKTSRNRKSIYSVITRHPKLPSGPINYLRCVSKNGRFKNLDIQPGDLVRFFVNRDEHGKYSALDLHVLKVFDNDSLVVQESLPREVLEPTRIDIWRLGTDNIEKIDKELTKYVLGGQNKLNWEISPDSLALEQTLNRLNQWLRGNSDNRAWEPDPLLREVSPELLRQMDLESLSAGQFKPHEGRLLQEAIWLRDISNWVRGDATEDLAIARRLFDWTIRNIQLETRDALGGLYRRPWQALLYGRGTFDERAWIFSLLAREQGLDVVMLALPEGKDSQQFRPWLPALWSEGQLYLFDTRLGLAIVGKTPGTVATLSEVRQDEQLLRQLDIEGHTYPVDAGKLEKVVAWIEASPLSFTRRVELFEKNLAGENKVRLRASPTILATQLKEEPNLSGVTLWPLPFETLAEQLTRDKQARAAAAKEFNVFPWRPQLWKARVLHFKGTFHGEKSAKYYYRKSRPSSKAIEQSNRQPYEKGLLLLGKEHASYWLGLLLFDEGQYEVAKDFLEERTLKAFENSQWTSGAKYNLGRCYESMGKLDLAKQLYLEDESPQAHGNKLRARMLSPAK